MTKKSISRLLQASLMCCLAVLFTACDDIFASEDNPTPAYLSMSDKPVTIKAGDTYRRKAISVTSAVVEYSSSDTNVATVDGEGVVTAIAEGTATITATATGYSTDGKKIYQPASVSYVVTVKSVDITLSAVTSEHIGCVVTTDGYVYATAAAATAASKTAAAMITYVSSTGHGLALALTDETPSDKTWATAKSTCESKAAISLGTWKMATKDDWTNMINACKNVLGTNGNYKDLRDGFSSVGGVNIASNYYWSSTDFPIPGPKYCINFSNGSWVGMDPNPTSTFGARACLEF